jgi:hypothetical protein
MMNFFSGVSDLFKINHVSTYHFLTIKGHALRLY